MSDLKFTMITNIIIKSVYIICITLMAIHFEKVGICWWYLLALFLGYDYKENPINKGGNTDG